MQCRINYMYCPPTAEKSAFSAAPAVPELVSMIVFTFLAMALL